MQAVPFFMSMSIATPVEEPTSDKKNTTPTKTSPTNLNFCIKNTFIEVFEDQSFPQSLRRSASAPPTPRGTGASPHDTWDITSPMKPSRSESSISTDAEMDPFDDSCGESVASDSGGVTLTLAELLPAPEVPSRTKLSASAKVWAPNRRVGGALQMPSDVKKEFTTILTAAQTALMSCARVQQVGSMQREENWLLEASCLHADLPNAHMSLGIAKQAMLYATAESKNIRVLGYNRTPFAPISSCLGFSAKFAFVDDEASACWNLLATGACRHGCNCRWQHPTYVVTMNVTIKAAGSQRA